MAFTISQNNDGFQLLTNLLNSGGTAGLSNFSIALVGDGRAFGTFQDDPFSLTNGITLSTGQATHLVGANTRDGRTAPGIDLSTDFGAIGNPDDTISIQIDFDVNNIAERLYFQYVFGSEEFREFGGSVFNDSFRLELNGTNLATLSDLTTSVTINNLVSSPDGAFHPDYIDNPVGVGPNSSITKLDGYTRPLLFTGNLIQNARNTLVITVRDAFDGIFDSALLIKGGTLGSVRPPDISGFPWGDGGGDTIPPGGEDGTTGGDGSGGSTTFPIDPSGGTGGTGGTGGIVEITNFGGVGRGARPSASTIAAADTLQFEGVGLTADNLLLTQVGADLEVSFEGLDTPIVRLKTFQLENLDNLTKATGASVNLGNILFDGQTAIADSFDVFNAEWTNNSLFNRNSVTFLNDRANTVKGFNNSADVINGQGGNDRLEGLSGNDILRGGAGTDTLLGGDGDDTLVGNAGSDRLTGGSGSDAFRLRLGDGTDTITDFNITSDRIELGGGLSPTDISLVQGTGSNASHTLLLFNNGVTSETLAILRNVRAIDVSPSSILLV
ncbi:MAG: choice-of-anchor L domain-containing protein [Oculatellaceae cyanobacterium bins.114]|nr:choice-of-anchor L domain-containing protein [Oculatellaceae cyanobacterium bins.114]